MPNLVFDGQREGEVVQFVFRRHLLTAKKGFFRKTVVDLGLDKIQSISYGVPGLIAGIFGYGTILIQTGVGDLVISEVKTPAKIYDKLQNVMKGSEK